MELKPDRACPALIKVTNIGDAWLLHFVRRPGLPLQCLLTWEFHLTQTLI